MILFFGYLFAYINILIADYNYADDLYRVFGGYHGWFNSSRYVSQFFSCFLHTGWYLADISPLGQIIASMFLALSSAVVVRVFCRDGRITLINIVTAGIIGLCPFFLSNISYKYDSPYMALAVLVSVLPFLFIDGDIRVFAVVSCLCMLVMCSSFQAASGIYPVMMVFLAADRIQKNRKQKELFRVIAVSAISYCGSLLLYALVFVRSSDKSRFHADLFGIVEKYLKRSRDIFSDFRPAWTILFVGMIISFLILEIVQSKLQKWKAAAIAVLTLLIASVLIHGVYLWFDFGGLEFSERQYMAVGCFMTFIAVSVSKASKWKIMNLFSLCLIWCFLIFSLIYGNALIEQERYTDYRIQLAISDLNELPEVAASNNGVFIGDSADFRKGLLDNDKETAKIIQVKGDIGYCQVIENMIDIYPMLKLIPVGFGGGFFGEYLFFNYHKLYGFQWAYGPGGDLLPDIPDLSEKELPVLKETLYHTIKGDGDYFMLELK